MIIPAHESSTVDLQVLRIFQLEVLLALAEVVGRESELDIGFQGGTCLHLSYQSPRYSEDLDFLAAGMLERLEILMIEVAATVSARMLSQGYKAVKLSGRGGKASALGLPHNPRIYNLVMPADRVDLPARRVKVEFMGVAGDLLKTYERELRVPVVSGALSRASVLAPLPVATLDAIEGDKVVALALRTRPKARDVYDLGWIAQQRPRVRRSVAAIETSGSFYGAPDTATLLGLARRRLAEFTPVGICAELEPFLPAGALSAEYAAVLMMEAGRTLAQFQDVLDGPDGVGTDPAARQRR